MTDTIEARARRITAEVLGAEPDAITAESDLRDALHMDSMDGIELVMALEEEFGIELDDDALERVRTFGDLCAICAPVTA